MLHLAPLTRDGAVGASVAASEPPFVGPAAGVACCGVADFDGAEEELTPIAFLAVTVNVYAIPLVSPETVHSSGPLDQTKHHNPTHRILHRHNWHHLPDHSNTHQP